MEVYVLLVDGNNQRKFQLEHTQASKGYEVYTQASKAPIFAKVYAPKAGLPKSNKKAS